MATDTATVVRSRLARLRREAGAVAVGGDKVDLTRWVVTALALMAIVK